MTAKPAPLGLAKVGHRSQFVPYDDTFTLEEYHRSIVHERQAIVITQKGQHTSGARTPISSYSGNR